MRENTIICGDCLEVMKGFPDNLADLVFCSPPYGPARTYGIDFKLKGQAWVDWALERYVECLRVSKGLVAWVVEGSTKNFRYSATPILLMADLHRAGVHLRKPPAFHRVGIPGSGGPDWLRNDYEFIICATSGGKLPWSDNTAMGEPCKYATGGKLSYRNKEGVRANHRRGYHSGGSTQKKHEQQARPKIANPGNVIQQLYTANEVAALLEQQGNVIKCNVGGGTMGSKLAHENEAPFPEKLAEFFVRSFCPPGGIVLDPFSGSGTTLATAEKTGRKWIGIDIRESQVELSNKRIKEARAGQGALFDDTRERQ